MRLQEEVDSVVVRFAGDSGDGIQVLGTQFTQSSVLAGNDICTLPDFPAEIRAPQGTLPGVSGFQLKLGSTDILTPGDEPDALVAMNPAALKVNIDNLRATSLLIINTDKFVERELKKAGYERNPLEGDELEKKYRLIKVDMTSLTRETLKDFELTVQQKDLCKNFFALGLVMWLFDRPIDSVERWLEKKFKNKPIVADANKKVFKSGYYFGETTENFVSRYQIAKATFEPGIYRKISGNEAISLGIVASAHLSQLEVVFGGYPITPASDIISYLVRYNGYQVKTAQVEDEIAGIGVAIGGSYAGGIGITATSGPGICLQLESMGLAVITEIPLIVINVQRGGPSTGLPTKTEQGDLLQALYGRHGESPLVILAPQDPSDCFNIMIEATRIALEFNIPVMVLSEGYIANGTEPWKIPNIENYEPIQPLRIEEPREGFKSYERDLKTGSRWLSIPGTKGLENRIGGLEKNEEGGVSYDPENHQKMIDLRANKINKIAQTIPLEKVHGKEQGDLVIVSWGGTYGAIHCAINRLIEKGYKISQVHIRYLNPLPRNLGEILARFKHVIVPELNLGQLSKILREKYLIDVKSVSKVQGKPFTVKEIEEAVLKTLEG